MSSDIERAVILCASSTYDAEYRRLFGPKGLDESMVKTAATSLLREALERGCFSIEWKEPAKDEFRGTLEVEIALLSTQERTSMESRIAARQGEVATIVAEKAKEHINNWGSDFGWEGLSKEDACRFVDNALHLALAETERK